MNRSEWFLWTRRGVVLGLLGATASIGCSPLNLIAFLGPHDEKVSAQYPLTFDKDSPKKDKDEVVVLLLVHTTPGTGTDYITADRELAEKLAKVLPEVAKAHKDNKKKIRIITPKDVDKFKMNNPHWRRMPAGEIGAKLEADFVLEIELTHVQLYQPNTPANDKLYEGRAELTVNIYEIDKNGGTLKDNYSLSFMHPDGIQSVSFTISAGEFKQQYIEKLAYKIALHHVDHKKTNTFGSGTGPAGR